MPTLLCVPILVNDTDAAIADAALARDHGADIVEYRIDACFSGSGDEAETQAILRLAAESPLPCIITCRPTWEGGHYDGPEDARVALFERLGTSDAPPAYIDVELAAYSRSANLRQKVNLAVDHPKQARPVSTRLILSMHDFDGRPADLARRLAVMRAEPAAAVHKVAFRARSLRDNLELLDLLAERDRPTIALGMGEFGLMSRVLAPKFGGFLTFASLHPQGATAPGQPTIGELLDLYRFRSITAPTGVYGIVGWPVGHSLSPLVHNAGFEAVGHDGVYLPLPIAAAEQGGDGSYESFKATVLELVHHPRLHFRGASVTIPHKENLARLAAEQGWTTDGDTAACGAANTIVVERSADGAITRMAVANTDAPAAVACLQEALGEIAGVRVAILGAGGVARAIAFALARRGAEIIVYNRSRERADHLAQAVIASGVRASADDWAALPHARAHAFVNCTPVGMKGGPDPDGSPLPVRELAARPTDPCGPQTVVMETVYNPVRTALLNDAREVGWRAIDGVEMFVRQAAAQFTAWTGHPAPMALFGRLVRESLDR
ncbi:MAG TPA: type I 3-dehydroquinate dehydratase [Phycisphaerales bacterium]|nr:type I 3-dehydroquinate dehydratase [Phycisphaerales bacterium]